MAEIDPVARIGKTGRRQIGVRRRRHHKIHRGAGVDGVELRTSRQPAGGFGEAGIAAHHT